MSEEKILTEHPLGKTGRNISRAKYDVLKKAILQVLDKKELNHTELMAQVNDKLRGSFQDNIGWYAETVKLDLEAKNIIGRTKDKPQKYRLLRPV